jgi:predicted transcriptional regulator of viral defense system
MRGFEGFIFNKMRSGQYTFSLSQALSTLKVSPENLNVLLYRYKQRGKIALVRNGFYAIVPPQYSQTGVLPIYMYIDDLMKSLGKDYYLSLFSAAEIYGATHQQTMQSYIITVPPKLRSVKNEKQSINFLTKKQWDRKDISVKKSEFGYFNVSSPELTAFDLIAYMHLSSITCCAEIISQLVESFDIDRLQKSASRFEPLSALQRLGYILDVELNKKDLAEAIFKALSGKKIFYVPLSIHNNKKGVFNTKWKVIKNTEIEIDYDS